MYAALVRLLLGTLGATARPYRHDPLPSSPGPSTLGEKKKKSQASTEGRHEGMVSSINQWGHKPWGASHCPAAILMFLLASPGSADPLSCRVFPGIIYQLAQVKNSVGIPLDTRLLLYRNNQQDELLRGCNVTIARKIEFVLTDYADNIMYYIKLVSRNVCRLTESPNDTIPGL